MPARLYVLAILVFWIGSTAWLFHRELWPRLRTGEPPPFIIDLTTEAQRSAQHTLWTINRGGDKIGTARTSIEYDDTNPKFRDTYRFISEIGRLTPVVVGPLEIGGENLLGMYRVTREGELRETSASGKLKVRGTGLLGNLGVSADFQMGGEVVGRQFIPTENYIDFGGNKFDLHLEPVEFTSQGSILNPLHPVNRVAGLRRGQHWQIPLVDPLADSLAALARKDPALEFLIKKKEGLSMLQAEVLPDTQTLNFREHPVACLVIEYRGNDMTAHTWVREEDGLVLRQEATLWGEELRLDRQ
jgi:hypothetical protein